MFEHAHDWIEHGHCVGGRKLSVLSQLSVECVALDVFHHEIDRAVAGSAQIVNCNRIRVAKASRRLALALEAAQPFGIAAHLRRQDFNRDAIAEQNVPRAIDRAHPPFAQHAFDLILAVEHAADQGRRIFFQNFTVLRAKAHRVIEFFVADRAVLHW